MYHPNDIKTVSLCLFFHLHEHRCISHFEKLAYYCTAEDDVATAKDSSSPPKHTSTGGVASQYPSEPPPPYTEQPSYPVHVTSQAIPALLPNGATLPGCQAPPSEVDLRAYQPPLNYPQQLFYQGAPGGLVVAGVSVLLIKF